MCSYIIVGNLLFLFCLKKMSLLFWMRVYFKGGGVKFFKIFSQVTHKEGGGWESLTDLEFFDGAR